jgi:murein DD-endopeptidase MepM/ murein hydrolase activator NlpD
MFLFTGSSAGDEALARKDIKEYEKLSQKVLQISKDTTGVSDKLLKAKGDRLPSFGSPIDKLNKDNIDSGGIKSSFDPRSWKGTPAHGHKGIDVAAAESTEIKAALDGSIEFKKAPERKDKKGLTGYGYYAEVKHKDGFSTLYAHMNEADWNAAKEKYSKVDEKGVVQNKVKKGDVIGGVGTSGASTGNHLHFEVRINNQAVDPQKVLRKTLRE